MQFKELEGIAMNKFSVSAQYVFLLLIAEGCELFVSLLALAFAPLSTWVVFVIRIPLVSIYFYSLIYLSDKFGKVFTVSLVFYITNTVLTLMTAFVPDNEINAGLLAFLNVANQILLICAAFFVMTGLMRIAHAAGNRKQASLLDWGRFIYLTVYTIKTMLIIWSVGSTIVQIAQVVAIMVDIFVLYLYQSTHALMKTHHARRS